MLYDLSCRYDSRASFYGKAKVEVVKSSIEQVETLFSYGTLVARVITNFNTCKITYEYMGKYSQTTTRHQKEFFRQHGLTDTEIKELFEKETLVKEA